jgi:hypothetical protein
MTTYWVQYSFTTSLQTVSTDTSINMDLDFKGQDLIQDDAQVSIVADAFGGYFQGASALDPYLRSQQQLGAEGIVGSDTEYYATIMNISIVNSFVVGSAPPPTVLLGPTAQSATLPTEYGSDGSIVFQDKGFIYNTTAWEEITISDNTTSTISIADAPTVYETPSGTPEAVFNVTLSAASQDTVTVDYATQDGTAQAGTDYQAESGTLTFAPGQTTATIGVPIIGTELAQQNEAFSVVLSNPTDSGEGTPTISGNPATGTIDALFTDGADVVNFNSLTSDQQAAIAAGAETTNGYGGDDIVTLPSSGDATFTTGSKSGDTYTVNGGGGNYTIVEGGGTETITINGNGNSTITAGSGNDTISIAGNGANNITIGYGTDKVSISGSGANTIAAGTSSAGIAISNFSGSLTGSAPSPSPGATVTLTSADSGNATIGSNSILELATKLAVTATLTFGSIKGGTLKIDGTTMPTGSIRGLQVGDVIDLADPIKTEAIDGTTLILNDTSGRTFTCQIAGAIAGNGFQISNDGSGGSDLTLKAPPALDSQSTELGGKILDAFQSGRDALFKGSAIALDNGDAAAMLEASDTIANACAVVGVGVNFTIAGATLTASLQNASSPEARYEAVENFDVDVTNTVAKAAFVFLAQASPAVEAAFLGGLVGTTLVVASGPAIALALAGVALGFEASVIYDEYLSPVVTNYERQNFESAHPIGPIQNVQDGYLSGATVFVDANGTGKLAANDVSTTTDANGNFTLTGGSGPLIAFGGTDISTGLTFKGQLEAPSGSAVVDPLTTLISGLQADGLTLATAEQDILGAFGLPSNTDLTTLDPIAGAQGGNAVSAGAYAAGAKVIDTADAIAAAFETASSGFLGAFEDAFAGLESDIKTLSAGQSLNLTDQQTITALINSVAKTEGVHDSSFVSTLSTNIVASNTAVDANLAQDGASSSLITDVSTMQAAIQSSTFDLTKGVDTIAGEAGNDTIIATSTTLSSGDKIDGGGGSNTLALEGPGTFNLALPTTLTNVQTITATEGQAAYSGGGQTFAAQNQIVVLRAGLNATVNVEPDASLNANDPKPATITIVGAANDDTIDLGSGNDLVTVGKGETINLGAGDDTIIVNSATIGATIGNGTGQNTLDVTGGGTMAMGANITGIADVLLSPASVAYHFIANTISGLTISDGSTMTADTLTAGGAHQTLTGGGAGSAEFVGVAAGDDTFKDTAALFNHDTIAGFGNNGDVIDLSDVSLAGLKPLSYVQNTSASGTLTVSDGAHTAAITLLGQYMANAFHPGSDGGPGTAIVYQPASPEATLTTSQHV